MQLSGRRLPAIPRWILLCLGIGSAGSLFTIQGLREWYPGLKKPSFNPPNSIFGPVWTTLYILMGLAAGLIEQGPGTPAQKRASQTLFAAQLALNLAWSALFFTLRSPRTAFIGIIGLWVTILLTIRAYARLSPLAAALLVPYLLWVTFATLLNGAIWRLNPNER